MRSPSPLPRRLAALVIVEAALPVGCGRKVEYVAEPEKATAILESVLAAWRDGATCEDLRGRSPPIHVADEQWLRGAKIESFTLGENFTSYAAHAAHSIIFKWVHSGVVDECVDVHQVCERTLHCIQIFSAIVDYF